MPSSDQMTEFIELLLVRTGYMNDGIWDADKLLRSDFDINTLLSPILITNTRTSIVAFEIEKVSIAPFMRLSCRKRSGE